MKEKELKSFMSDQIMRRNNKDATANIYAALVRHFEHEEKDFWDKSFNGLNVDITASKLILPPNGDYKKGWNAAMDKALGFVKMYKEKEGLFQI